MPRNTKNGHVQDIKKITIKKFNMKNIKQDAVIVMIGKRRTGKSFLLKDLMYHHQDIPVGKAISPTEKMTNDGEGFFRTFMPKMLIDHKYNSENVQKFMKRQEKVILKNGKNKKLGISTRYDPRAFLILDDCLADDDWAKNTEIRELFMNGRHLKIMFLLTMQYPLGIGPALRTNIDYVFILRENRPTVREILYKQYGGLFDNLRQFNQVMDNCTQNYECLVIDNCTQSNKLEDQLFWYKANEHSSFKLCNPEYWRFSAMLPDDDSDDDTDNEDTAMELKIQKTN